MNEGDIKKVQESLVKFSGIYFCDNKQFKIHAGRLQKMEKAKSDESMYLTNSQNEEINKKVAMNISKCKPFNDYIKFEAENLVDSKITENRVFESLRGMNTTIQALNYVRKQIRTLARNEKLADDLSHKLMNNCMDGFDKIIEYKTQDYNTFEENVNTMITPRKLRNSYVDYVKLCVEVYINRRLKI